MIWTSPVSRRWSITIDGIRGRCQWFGTSVVTLWLCIIMMICVYIVYVCDICIRCFCIFFLIALVVEVTVPSAFLFSIKFCPWLRQQSQHLNFLNLWLYTKRTLIHTFSWVLAFRVFRGGKLHKPVIMLNFKSVKPPEKFVIFTKNTKLLGKTQRNPSAQQGFYPVLKILHKIRRISYKITTATTITK